MEKLVQDLRYSLRMFRKSPLVTAAAVFSLAVGIGANTAMFSWVDGLVAGFLPARRASTIDPTTALRFQ
jgi:hypothetical protein